ncbi:Sporulation related domain protein [Tsuneonella dongtanensis]|uniref:Sporulation related domain protein n=1 Tax=Tsuneonella dongtanensis TaxID=692370 RepID=A0A1B2AGN5_9SPHN|nr:SPOR domain-containing protein [Tsuneonella dongtanensis]ANY21306.1 Sporulation related domain protein [Tsuneonella dongtanensis]
MTGREDDDYVDDEQLTLADDDERLPWLESGDEDEEAQGVDTGRIFGFAILALLALVAFVGGIWWFGNRSADNEVVADGSTIEAPEGPYKERPEDPGGKQFEGTGNLAPAVGEGRDTEGRIADSTPRPGIEMPKPGPAPTAAASAPAAGGVGVQVGAYSTREQAEAGWQKLQSQTDKLAGVSHRVIQGQADIGTVFRLQAIAGDAAAASRLCASLKSDGVACQVKP